MKALRLNEPGKLEFFIAEEPAPPGPGEALVRVLRTGICGTDLHAYRGKQPFFTYPRILGHELGVEVLATNGEAGVAPGDVCCVEPFLNCGKCPACRRGKTNCCESLKTLGVHTDGAMQERYVLPTHKLHKSPGLRPEQLATVEPLCIGSHAVWRAQPEAGDSLLVIGAGPIGLAVVEASRALGIEPVMMEVSSSRLAFCEKQVKLRTVDARRDVKEQLRALLDGELPRVIVDCTGHKGSMESCFDLVAHGGKVVFVGIHLGELSFYNPNYHAREITLMSSRNATASDFRRVLDNLASGKSSSDYWLAGMTAPEDVPAEFPKWLDVEAGIIKPVINWGGMTALAIGGKAPGFTLPDQTGRSRTLASLQGRNGLLLVFVRSADWCIFCKAELVELEQQVKAYAARGIQVAAITYDSPAVLKHFAERRGITFPLLSDEGSRVIRAFGILNETIPPDNPAYGVPLPVTYWLDSKGVVKRKYAEDDYRERISSANIFVREFKDGAVAGQEIQAKHLTLRTSASNSSIYVGGRVMLILDLVLPSKMHVYAPGVQGYKPIEWVIAESKNWSAAKPEFPASRMLRLPAIGETVPVYEGTVRITRELSVGRPNAADGPAIVEGVFRYQACDDKVCYVPEQVPLKWTFPVAAIDSVRVPPELRKGVQ